MMKKLSELGISPTPWKKADDGMGYKDIWCNAPVTEDSEGENIIAEAIDAKDASLIAAAPKMYAKAWELITAFDNRVMSPKHIEALRKALAEAAGEGVGDGKQ